jgi:HPt (histidine-containing phosphotransfer) domain-containing protein
MTHDSNPPGDPVPLERLRAWGGEKLQRRMVASFLERAPERIATARAAAESDDAPGVERPIHSLKASAGQLGAVVMQALCEEIEQRAERGEAIALLPRLHALAIELERWTAWLYDPAGGALERE